MEASIIPDPSRKLKAKKILSILQDFLGHPLDVYRVLDIGCADGSITQELAPFFLYILGSDIDFDAIQKTEKFDQPNLSFIISDGSKLAISDASVGIVVCAQVYEHAENQVELADEIWRVLSPGGICFFSGPNRLAIMEEHYWLPFLSWLPQPLADFYMRIMRKGAEYDIKPMFLWQLKRLWQRFDQFDYTEEILKNPQKFAMQKNIGILSSVLHKLPAIFIRVGKIFIPNYNWILVKPK